MPRTFREPIPAGPFLEWFDQRAALYASEASDSDDGVARMVEECGWPVDSGTRRIYRWRHETTTGLAPRDVVEDALNSAGTMLWEVYPDIAEEADRRLANCERRIGLGRHMTDDQLLAAHKLYMRLKLTHRTLAALIWEKYGYSNMETCAYCVGRNFSRLGLGLRYCAAKTVERKGERPCSMSALHGSDFCQAHQPNSKTVQALNAGREKYRLEHRAWITDRLLREAQVMRSWGKSYREIAEDLIDSVPVDSVSYLSNKLSRELRAFAMTRDGEWRRAA